MPLPPGPGTFAAVAPRLELDAALVDLAVKAGVTVITGAGFDGDARRAAPTTSSLDVDGSATGRAPATSSPPTACGARSRKALGLTEPGYLGEWHAFRQYGRGVTGPARDRLYVWFEPDLLPGYAWSFPLPGGRVNVGFGVHARRHAPDPGHEAAVGGPRSTARTSAAALGPDVDARGPAHRVADPRPASTGRRCAAAGSCSSATRRWPPT